MNSQSCRLADLRISYQTLKVLVLVAFSSMLAMFAVSTSHAADLIRITKENYDSIVPAGKEIDAIYGDFVLRNDQVSIVIAAPKPGRKANMTVRGVGGMPIDYTTRFHGSDQLSCFYPSAAKYVFDSEEKVAVQVNSRGFQPIAQILDKGVLSSKKIDIKFVGSSVAKNQTSAEVTYSLANGQPFLAYSVELTNNSPEPRKFKVEDALRCDGNLFKMTSDDQGRVFAEDIYFGQCYGFALDDGQYEKKTGRMLPLISGDPQEVAEDDTFGWSGKLFCDQGRSGVEAMMASVEGRENVTSVQVSLKSPLGPIPHAEVDFLHGDEVAGHFLSRTDGAVRTHLAPGTYELSIRAIGYDARELELEIGDTSQVKNLTFDAPSRVRANIRDGEGKPIAAKVQFIGIEDTPTPDFGPDSAIYAMKNAVYCAKGKFEQPLEPGKYRVIISHGPEYDAEVREIVVEPGKLTQLDSQLPRVVDTTGWISSEFHSHSTPSGDNVSHQTGRVLNLLAEHLEFAPCTEHNRIDTYSDDLELLGATDAMATCTGMELTGGPLPINHQNAFPMVEHRHEQDGGAPQTDADPVKQIERLALWDNSSSKVVQTNHPNIPSILGDRDLNGEPDGGFRGMLGWMDVIEVHPPQGIFEPADTSISPNDKRKNPIFHWMRLLNIGYRITGVVNTDAHYNFHGSGWLRNYMQSSTDDPSKISIDEMIHCAEHGHMIMTTGPFMEVELRGTRDGKPVSFISGEDVRADELEPRKKLWVRVQCPNWFDINRVQVFLNGRPNERMNFTRKTTPGLFSDDTVRFEAEITLPVLQEDTHLIVAAIGEGLELGEVMGSQYGKRPPVAVCNPIFIDADGSGFQGNGDDLGIPFMIPTK